MDRVRFSDRDLGDEARGLIVDRLRAAVWIAFVGIALSLAGDTRMGPVPQAIMIAKGGALVWLPFAAAVLSRLGMASRAAVLSAGVAVVWSITLVPVVGGVMREDPLRVAYVVSFLALAMGSFVPWGARAQGALVASMLASFAGGFMDSSAWSGVPVQPLFAGAAATLSSVYIAGSLEKQRWARRRAELLVEQQAEDLKAQALDLVAARDAALASTRVRSEFLANMSHELRTPLHGVLGLTDILLDSELATDQRQLVRSIRRCGDTLSALVDKVLDFERLAAGQLTLRTEVFDPAAVVREVVEMVTPTAREKQLQLAQQIESGCPALVEGDRVRFLQVVTNLVGNAVKFTDAGEVGVRLRVQARGGDHAMLYLAVRDTGIGVPPELHDAIFEPFRQADGSMTRPQGGAGLGLTIARQLTEMMDGRIGLRSVPGEGSTFWIEVPLRVVEERAVRIAG